MSVLKETMANTLVLFNKLKQCAARVKRVHEVIANLMRIDVVSLQSQINTVGLYPLPRPRPKLLLSWPLRGCGRDLNASNVSGAGGGPGKGSCR